LNKGGPLVVRGNDGRWQLVGITSFGFGCGDTGAYTRASGYYNWITSTVQSN
jgi:secreted trypsin-like serine protease